MFKEERTFLCINDLVIIDNYKDRPLIFHSGREYQVDVFPLYYQVYQNGGWNDFVFLSEEELSKYFKLIE